ncbi:MAG TPA: maleylacetoacetate isomerase [Kofleriaceae bacterium]|nr:maleylacetoacetate isomerase [Kofleriaceae bacterium]
MKLRLHNYWRSSASHRVRIALGLKGLAWEYVVVNILEGKQHDSAYTANNAMAQVPTLEIIEDDGRTHHLTQSLPIIEYLDERFPEPPLFPTGPRALEDRARVRAIAEMVNSGIQPLQNLSTTNALGKVGGDVKTWVQGFITRGLEAIERELSRSAGAGRYCVGDTPTLADCVLVPQIHSARRFAVDLAAFPRISAIGAACEELPAFSSSAPDRQPDAVRSP